MKNNEVHKPALRRNWKRAAGLSTTALLGAALLIAGAPAAQAAPTASRPPPDLARTASSIPLQVNIPVFDGSTAPNAQPASFTSNRAGTLGFVTSRGDTRLRFVDLKAERFLERSIELDSPDGAGYVILSQDENTAFVELRREYWSAGIARVNLLTDTAEVLNMPTAAKDPIERMILSRDGSTLYVLNLNGTVFKIDATTGAEIARVRLPGMNFYSLTFEETEDTILVGGPTLNRVQTADMSISAQNMQPGINTFQDVRMDTNPNRMYFSTNSDLGMIEGDTVTRAEVGPIVDVLGDDATNRAFSTVPSWEMVMSADLATGERSESYREQTAAGWTIARNPATGDLLTANRGYNRSASAADIAVGNTVSIIYTAQASNPEDQHITTIGEEVTFSSSARGIRPGNGSYLRWETSADDVTWTPVPDSADTSLTVSATEDALALGYRLAWHDDFWGTSGVTDSAKIVAAGPHITRTEALPGGTEGVAYPDTEITATGQSDLRWSADLVAREVSGLPSGLRINADTGVISGTPTTAGDYSVTVTVTDAVGTDAKTFPLTIAAAAVVPTPTPTPTDGSSATPSPSPTPTDGSSEVPSPTPSPTPTTTPTGGSSETPEPTATPSEGATERPTESPAATLPPGVTPSGGNGTPGGDDAGGALPGTGSALALPGVIAFLALLAGAGVLTARRARRS